MVVRPNGVMNSRVCPGPHVEVSVSARRLIAYMSAASVLCNRVAFVSTLLVKTAKLLARHERHTHNVMHVFNLEALAFLVFRGPQTESILEPAFAKLLSISPEAGVCGLCTQSHGLCKCCAQHSPLQSWLNCRERQREGTCAEQHEGLRGGGHAVQRKVPRRLRVAQLLLPPQLPLDRFVLVCIVLPARTHAYACCSCTCLLSAITHMPAVHHSRKLRITPACTPAAPT